MDELIVRISGEITSSNFADYKTKMLDIVENINTDLKSSEDFSAAESTIKTLDKAEKAIDAAREKAILEVKDINALFVAMTDVSTVLRDTRLDLTKQVKTKKASIKTDAIKEARKELVSKMAEIDAPPFAVQNFDVADSIFADAVKGKRTIETISKALKTLIYQKLESFVLFCTEISKKTDILANYEKEYPSLFNDKHTLLAMDESPLLEVITSRISTFKAEEEASALKAKQLIKEDEERKAKAAKAQEVGPGPTPRETFSDNRTEPPRQQRRLGSKQPIELKTKLTELCNKYVLTVELFGVRSQAIDIATTVSQTLEPFGDVVISTNLNKPDAP